MHVDVGARGCGCARAAKPYEADVRVPFFARGPGIARGSTLRGPLLGIDLAPTFLQLAGMASAQLEALGMDGEPLAHLLLAPVPAAAEHSGAPPPASDGFSRDFLLEYFGEYYDGCNSSLAAAFPTQSFSLLDDGLNCGLRGPDSYKASNVFV